MTIFVESRSYTHRDYLRVLLCASSADAEGRPPRLLVLLGYSYTYSSLLVFSLYSVFSRSRTNTREYYGRLLSVNA